MTAADALRVAHLGAQAEIALVRRDAVAGPLLAQAARAAGGSGPGAALDAAMALVRGLDLAAAGPAAAARRKAAQALCRIAVQEAHAVLLGAAGPSR